MMKWSASIVIAAALLYPWSAADAASIHGELINGTTGEPVDGTVMLVNPSSGMMQEREVQAVGGKFTIDGLDAGAPIYLLRADHAGVMYTEIVRLEGQDKAHATLTVYETTASWDKVHVIVPYLAVVASEGHLQVETMYEVHNHAEPAATIADEDAQLRIYLPEDRVEMIRSYVSHHEIPLDREPVKTDEPGVYRIDYPLRPGDTQVGVAYSVPYADSAYTLPFLASRDVDEMTIYTINANMGISSEGVELGAARSVHGMMAYKVSNLSAGTTFDVTFTGGDVMPEEPIGEDPHGAGASPIVVVQPNRMESPSILLIIVILLVLVALVGVGLRGAESPLDRHDQVSMYYDVMLKRMAKLDDLHGAGVISPEVYGAKRAEMKTQLAALKYRLRTADSSKKKHTTHEPPRIAGNERTSTP